MNYVESLNIHKSSLKYKAMIGVGGIGSGAFFALSGNHTLGREESRGGSFLDRKDYCKLHIISHYVQTLLGPDFTTLPVGMVGDDAIGKRLLDEMQEAGIDLRLVNCSPGDQTLFSFCFVYPDGSGGNMTTDDSACSKIDLSYVKQSEPAFISYKGQGIALAVPEVPLDARGELLKIATTHDFFRIASFTSEEMPEIMAENWLSYIDLLAINIDEALAVCKTIATDQPVETVVRNAIEIFTKANPNLLISITAGSNGSWIWDSAKLNHQPKHDVDVQSTAGAGDAHLSGIIAGLTAGLSIYDAQQLGSLIAALSVTSPNTINKDISRKSLHTFTTNPNVCVSRNVLRLLTDT